MGGKTMQTLIERWAATLKSKGKKTKSMIRYKKGQYVKIKSSLLLEDTIILNLHVPNKIALKNQKAQIDRTACENRKTSTHGNGSEYSPPHEVKQTEISQRGFKQDNKLGLMEVYGTLHPTTETKLLKHTFY